jgi:hypothetical protein
MDTAVRRMIGHEGRRDRLRDVRQAVDDGEADGGHQVDRRALADELGHLRQEDEDRERVDEAGHHGPRDEAHQIAEPHDAGDDLEDPGQDGGGEQVADAVLLHERDHQERHGARRRRDHRRASARKRGDDGDAERGVEPDLRVDAGDDREGDRLGDEGKRHHRAGQELTRDVRSPFAPQSGQIHKRKPSLPRAQQGL